MTERREDYIQDLDIDLEAQREKKYFDWTRSQLTFQSMVDLVWHPYRFFETGISANKFYIVLFGWLIGMAGTLERQEKLFFQYIENGYVGNDLAFEAAASWGSIWTMTALIGLIGAVTLWWLGGWWYNVRLKMVWTQPIDKVVGRRVYYFNRLVHDVPLILFVGIQTILYPSRSAALLGDDLFMNIGAILMCLLLNLSAWNSYRSVIRLFPVNRDQAALWFLYAPMAYFTLTFIATFI